MDHDYELTSTGEFLELLNDGMEFKENLLRDADLTRSNAYDLVFNQCRFINVDFSDVDWDGLKCFSSEFINCHFIASSMENAVFKNCTFFDAEKALGCSFSRANLVSAQFSQCDISSCNFEGAKLFRIAIQDSKAIGAKFFRARFNDSVKLTKNLFKYADLRGVKLSKCKLSENDFVWAALDEADFTRANLMGSNLSGATMKYAKFAGADLRGANLSTFDIRLLNSQGIKIFESQMRQLLENCEVIVYPDRR